MEPNTELAERLEVVAKDIHNLVDARMEIDFHVHLVEFDMDIVEHLAMDDLVVVGGDLYILEHVFVSNEIFVVVSLACVDGDLHIFIDVEFDVFGVDSLVADVNQVFLMKHYV